MGLFTRTGRQDLSGPGVYVGGTAVNATQSGAGHTMPSTNTSAMRARESSGVVPRDSNVPTGYGPGSAWFLARRPGEMGAAADGDASSAGAMLSARTLEGAAAGEATTAADLALRATLSAAATSTATTTAALSTVAALEATAAGSAAASGALSLRVPLEGTSAGSASSTANLTGTASMEGNASPFTELSPETLAAAVLGANVEGDVDVAESLRLHNAVLGGKVTGAGTATERFRDLADAKDRVVAAVDAAGNRTTVTRDLD